MTRFVFVDNETIKDTLIKRSEILKEMGEIKDKMSELEDQMQKLAIQMQKQKEIAAQETTALLFTLDLTETEEITKGSITEEGTVQLDIVDRVEEYRENYLKAKKEAAEATKVEEKEEVNEEVTSSEE